jgi:hypothetical protein
MSRSNEKALSLQLKDERQTAKEATKAERKAKCEMDHERSTPMSISISTRKSRGMGM